MQRKVFRVEQMFADHRVAAALENAADKRPTHEHAVDATPSASARDFALLRDTIASNRRELSTLLGKRSDRRMTRAAAELGAAIEAMEKATQKILQATECIDDNARALGATLKSDYERGLTQDIQEQAVAIYEACNFQDLAGQRIGKVIDMLGRIEAQLAAMVERSGGSAAADQTAPPERRGSLPVNGPRLDGEPGHIDQHAIDAMFN